MSPAQIVTNVQVQQDTLCLGDSLTISWEIQPAPEPADATYLIELIESDRQPAAVVHTMEFRYADPNRRDEYLWMLPASFDDFLPPYRAASRQFRVRITFVKTESGNESEAVVIQEPGTLELLPLTKPSIVLCPGGNDSLRAIVATGQDGEQRDAPVTQWFRSGGAPVTLAGPEQPLLLDYSDVDAAGDYYAKAWIPSHACVDTAYSDTVEVRRSPAPAIRGLQPNQELLKICVGDSLAPIGLDVIGDRLSYEWRKIGRQEPITTQSEWPGRKIEDSDEGQYIVTVRNDCGADSVTFQIEVCPPPVFDVNLESRTTATVADNIVLSVEVKGSGTLQYQWFHKGAKVGGNSPFLVINSVDESDSGRYWVRVRSDCCERESAATELIVERGSEDNHLELAVAEQFSVAVGEVFDLALRIDNFSEELLRDFGVDRVTFTLGLNATIALPLDESLRGEILDDTDDRLIEIAMPYDVEKQGASLVVLPMRGLLGNAEISEVEIDAIEVWRGSELVPALPATLTSRIVITSIWRDADGRPRLYNPLRGALELAIDPNPVDESARVTLTARNLNGDAALMVYDILGKPLLAQPLILSNEVGRQIDLGAHVDIAGGNIYYCRLSSGKFSVVRILAVE